MKETNRKILFISSVKDNEDTFLLGRVRCFPQDWNIEQILGDLDKDGLLNENKSDVADKYKYTSKDPFVFMPLLPPYMSFIPKVDEAVWLLYSDPVQNWGKKEQFYTVVTKTSPFNVFLEDKAQGNALTNLGSNLVAGQELKSQKIDVSDYNGTDYKYPQKSYRLPIRGIFAEPCDNAIYGQGTTDLILKKDTVLLRAGKVNEMLPNSTNAPNRERGFLQISYFKSEKILSEPVTVNLNTVDESPLRKLLEYTLFNPENSLENFRGEIRIYDIASRYNYKNNEFTAETIINPSDLPPPFYNVRFAGQPISAITKTINYLIESLNKGQIDEVTEPIALSAKTINESFPFYYRPDQRMRDILKQPPSFSDGAGSFVRSQNLQRLIKGVNFVRNFSVDVTGDGLVSQKNKFGTSTVEEKRKIAGNSEFVNRKNSASILGSNKIFLISQDSVIPGTSPINMEVISDTEDNTLYGFSDNQINNNLTPNTEPLVRGYKLKELLNLIVRFLTSHSHPYHQLPPSDTSYAGVSIENLEQTFESYDDNVLNQNIRIN
jgi:hypothetical protein